MVAHVIWKDLEDTGLGVKKGGFLSPPPKKHCIWSKVLLKVLIKKKVQNYVSISMLIALFNDKHWQRSGNISRLLRSIIFWRQRRLELNMDSYFDGCVPQNFSDITRKCVCLLILIFFLEIEMLRHDPASSVSPINGRISKVQSSTE
jgi:hypothetical protein